MKVLLSVVMLVFVGNCAGSSPAHHELAPTMERIYQALNVLLADVVVKEKFDSLERRYAILDEIKTLRDLSHDLKDGQLEGLRDPSMVILSGNLRKGLDTAYEDFRNNYRESSREKVRSIVSVCVSCHSSSSDGPLFAERLFDPSKLPLNDFERAQFYVASRQFSKALGLYSKVISEKTSPSKHYWAWSNAVREALSITIRNQYDRVSTSQIVDAVIENENSPRPFRKNAFAWRVSLKAWSKDLEAESQTSSEQLRKANALFEFAKRLQRFPSDRNADIYYLRAAYYFAKVLMSGDTAERSAALDKVKSCENVLSIENGILFYYE